MSSPLNTDQGWVTDDEILRRIRVPDRWIVHAYYTVSPYAPDGSDRILAAGADLDRDVSEILILSADAEVIDRFGEHPVQTPFYHTGRWQTWSSEGRYVFYGAGTLDQPRFVRREVSTGEEVVVEGAMDGGTPDDGPLISGLLGMLQAANDEHRGYAPELSPVPFQARDRHGLFEYTLDPPSSSLRLSVAEILENHPDRDRLMAGDAEMRRLHRDDDGLTLLSFCVRWSPDASRFLFFFGHNALPSERGEPRIKYVMTARRDFTDVRVAMDLSYGRPGVHWSWQPDSDWLIGYGPDPDAPSRRCLAEVRYDGTGYRKISDHSSGGHPTVNPARPEIIVTDHYAPDGRVVFVARDDGRIVQTTRLPLNQAPRPPRGRSRYRTDAHPAFHPSGTKVLCNWLPGRHAEFVEIAVPA
jgi:hypothetical protein